MKKLATMILCGAMCLSFAACGNQETSDSAPQVLGESKEASTVVEESKEEAQSEEVQVEGIKGRISKKTYWNLSNRYMVDLICYPCHDEVGGQLENAYLTDSENTGKVYNVVTCYVPNGTELLWPEVTLDKMTSVTDIPEVMKIQILSAFEGGSTSAGNGFGSACYGEANEIEITKVQNAGDINGYECAYFEGKMMPTLLEGEIYQLKGYCTFLKQSGQPIIVASYDASADQSYNGDLEGFAKTIISSLYELSDAEVEELR